MTRELCLKLIKAFLDAGLKHITSWSGFAEARIIADVADSVSQDQLLSAMAYGVHEKWLTPDWVGVGMTPSAGSARRQRVWTINSIAKEVS